MIDAHKRPESCAQVRKPRSDLIKPALHRLWLTRGGEEYDCQLYICAAIAQGETLLVRSVRS